MVLLRCIFGAFTVFVFWPGNLAVKAIEVGADNADYGASVDTQLAQSDPLAPENRPNLRLEERPPSQQPLPQVSPGLPPAEDLLQPPTEQGPQIPNPELTGDRLCITGFEVLGSTVYSLPDLVQIAADTVPADAEDCEFSEADVAPEVVPTPGKQLTFAQVQQARDAITRRYINDGYLTSGAYLPPQSLNNGVVTIRIVEGTVEDIEVIGLDRLNPNYVRNRISRSAGPPLNTDKLLEGLQILQLDPLIETIKTELTAGIHPGTNRLIVEVAEADPYRLALVLDNARTPLWEAFNVGSGPDT